MDPAAAIKAGADLKPEGLKAAAHDNKYFGKGPDTAKEDRPTSAWVGPLAGSTGGVLLVVAVILWRGSRKPTEPLRRTARSAGTTGTTTGAT